MNFLFFYSRPIVLRSRFMIELSWGTVRVGNAESHLCWQLNCQKVLPGVPFIVELAQHISNANT